MNTIEKSLNKFKGENMEQTIERLGGWKPGMKRKFDINLLKKNKEGIKQMLPYIPKEYKNRFREEISNIIK